MAQETCVSKYYSVVGLRSIGSRRHQIQSIRVRGVVDMRFRTCLGFGILMLVWLSYALECGAQTMRVPSRRIPSVSVAPPAPAPAGALTITCTAEASFVGMAFANPANVTAGGTPPYAYSIVSPGNLTLNSATGVITGGTTAGALPIAIKATDATGKTGTATCPVTVSALPSRCSIFPTKTYCMSSGAVRDSNINTFYGTEGKLSYMNQIKSIYNGASSSATVSADLASLNFSDGMQVTVGTNIQAGSANSTTVSSGSIPTLSASAAGQATQNMLYGGTVNASGLYPLFATGSGNLGSASGWGVLADLNLKEGIDIQNFKSGTSVDVNSPSSHASAQIEGYLQYNSSNLAPNSTDFAGAVFVGGSYGYSYTSHGYARDYGFGNNVSNGIGQVSAGILISGVAKIALSRGFGPNQTYIDSTSMAQKTVNNFKAWSFGIAYQSPPPKQ